MEFGDGRAAAGELGCVVEKDGEFEWMETERVYE